MKLNRLLLLAFLTIVAGGCATNYHGAEYYGSPNNLPPALWDNALNDGETNGPVSPATAYVMSRRET